MKRIKIYMSHAIRGSKGPAATDADMQANNDAAMRAARVIRQVFRPLENQHKCAIEVYCPADHDEFVMIAYRNGTLTEAQILAVDCEIVERCQALIWYSGLGSSKGAEIEIKRARSQAIPIFELTSLNTYDLVQLKNFVEGLCQKNTETS